MFPARLFDSSRYPRYANASCASLTPRPGILIARGRLLEVSVAEGTSITPGVGERAPNFELPDERGRPFVLAREAAKGPVVLVFYRGDW